MTTLDLKLKKLHPDAKAPIYATPGAFCFDLHTTQAGVVAPGAPCVFGTGLAAEIPPGYALLIFSRSGHGFNRDSRLSNCVGIIDEDYRAEIKVKLTQDEGQSGTLIIAAGERIAQAALFPKIIANFIFVDDLSDTERGQGGFGSTGA